MRLSNKVAVVTGAGSGMGRAMTLGYSREGCRVAAIDLNLAAVEAVAREASEAGGGEVIPLQADVSESEPVRWMVAETVARFGKLDVLVNNAAIQLHGQDGPCLDVDEAVWDRTMAVNLRAPYLCSKYALPELIRGGGGSIVNIASPTAFARHGAGYTAYASSKGGLVTLTRVMAADYATVNVRVNAIIPGATETPLITEILRDESVRAKLLAATPLGRLGRAEDVVGIAVFLASDESACATGALFSVDGGLTMH